MIDPPQFTIMDGGTLVAEPTKRSSADGTQSYTTFTVSHGDKVLLANNVDPRIGERGRIQLLGLSGGWSTLMVFNNING